MPRKRKTAREQNQDLIEVKISLGKDMTGKRIQKSFYGRTKGEAREKADEYRAQYAKGETVNKSVLFAEWAETWLNTYKKDNVKEATFETQYKKIIENHLTPYFQNIKLYEIKPINIQQFYQTKTEYSESMVKKIKSTLFSIFETAIDNDIIIKNPAKNIRLPSYKKPNEKRFYTEKHKNIVIDFAKNHKYGLGIIIMLETGVRRGELLGLKWGDFDMDNNVLRVQRAVSDGYINGKMTLQIEENSNATKNHNRLIPFENFLKEILLKHKSESEYVIPNTKGAVNSPSNYSKRMYRQFMRDLKEKHPAIDSLSPHELRHTYGTLLKNRGVDIYTIQQLLGHSKISTTADIYIHNDIDNLKKVLGITSIQYEHHTNKG